MNTVERYRGCLLGLAAGDAVGTTVEFRTRGTFQPITDMIGGGPFDLKPGAWTDDTSMALCLATSLVSQGGFDPVHQMDLYCQWQDEGYLSSNGACFDIGDTVSHSLALYRQSGDPFSGSAHPHSAGNGCLMRLAPVPMFYAADRDRVLHFSGESARTTHGATECVDASRLFGDMIARALADASKEEILFEAELEVVESPAIQAIARGDYREKQEADIQGSGYVVESLEAALWCFLNTVSYEQAILMATNLGDDADTTAAICGQLAGAYYGEEGIPVHWRNQVVMRDEILALAEQLWTLAAAL
jgi:ADP-ribosyl-[dinitrogen reductase] hydrolase